MSWHEALLTGEQALIWTLVGGAVARLLVRKPFRTALHWLIVQAVHQAQIADSLKTDTDGGLKDLIDAIEHSEPAPKPGR